MTTKEFIVTKHNSLIEASYRLTLNEQRLILFCISQLDSRKPLPKDSIFTITAKEFAKMFKIEEKHAYESLETSSNDLYERDIKTYDKKYGRRFRWVYEVKYHKNEGMVTLGFSPSVTPYLTKLYEQFTSYNLNEIASLKSVYSIRLLEFLTQFKASGKFIISLDKFKERLELNEGYKRFYDLKRWVIEPAVKELREKSNFLIKWKPIKGERSKGIKQLEFIFGYKEENKISSYGKIKE